MTSDATQMLNSTLSRIVPAMLSGIVLMAPATAQTAAAPPAAPTAPTAPAAPQAKPGEAAPAAAADPLAQFAWLEGCWRGSVNKREFREHWMPPRGALMLGASHTVVADKTQDYEYLRIETRSDGVYYIDVAMGPGRKESAYKLVERVMDQDDEVFTFARSGNEFPQRVLYRHNAGGWLYATVEGKHDGKDTQVIYPLRRVGCETG